MCLRITQKERCGHAGQQRRRIDLHEVHGSLRIGTVRFEETIRIPPALFAAEQHLPVGGGLFEILLIRHPRQLQRFLKKPKSAEKIYRNKEDGKYNADYLIVHHLHSIPHAVFRNCY